MIRVGDDRRGGRGAQAASDSESDSSPALITGRPEHAMPPLAAALACRRGSRLGIQPASESVHGRVNPAVPGGRLPVSDTCQCPGPAPT
eukprot:368023-Rhodomonas_salina.1